MRDFRQLALLLPAIFSSFLPLVTGLTDTEIAFFSVRSCSVTYGAENGDTLSASITVTKDTSNDRIKIVTSGVPDHPTCDPDDTDAGDTCYTDPIETYFSDQNVRDYVPLSPVEASSSTGLPAGTVGYARNGVAIFSAYSRPCTDAIADEAIGFDKCQGHPMESGAYHYHQAASCIEGYLDAWDTKSEFFIGVALDGFPIYSMYDSDGELVTNSQLDDCHGYDPGTGYRYIANTEFPYMVGCFKGTPIDSVNEHCGRRRRLFSETKPNIRLRERQLTELCSVVNNSHCADSSCGFVCDEDCSLWTTGDDTENAADDDDGDAVCFSGDDLVTLETGDAIRLSEVRIGDRILSASKDGVSSFSDVVFLPHGANQKQTTFVEVITSKDKQFRATRSHLIMTCNGALAAVKDLSPGACLRTVDGNETLIASKLVQKHGIYTAVTKNEFLVIGGVVVSPFAINHDLVHAYYNIHRFVYDYIPSLSKSTLLTRINAWLGGVSATVYVSLLGKPQ